MIITERGEHIEIRINETVYDSHKEGFLDDLEVLQRVAAGLDVPAHVSTGEPMENARLKLIPRDEGLEVVVDGNVIVDPSEDGRLHVTAIVLRIAKALDVKCWFLDRAPYEDDVEAEPGLSG